MSTYPPPRKQLGQHFLIDTDIIQHIVRTLNPQTDDNLVEIGPGRGALTRAVLETIPTFTVIELDRMLAEQMRQHLPQLKLIEADALSLDFNTLANEKRLRVFGNLPYNISTPLIFHLFRFAEHIDDMFFMLQKEVVSRMQAAPNTKAYGRLSVMVQYAAKVTALFEVPQNAFSPPPKVMSQMVYLKPYHDARPFQKAHNEKLFHDVVNWAFQHRRKNLKNALKEHVTADVLEALTLDLLQRPENLSVQDFIQLSDEIHAYTSQPSLPKSPRIRRHFAIGDVQGCLPALKKLLHKIRFDPQHDKLLFAGDLINRGPESLETLRFIKALPHVESVMGNHDLALLAVAHQATPLREEDNFGEILNAPDADELLTWLQHRPFLYHDANLQITLTHAGIYPTWSLDEAILHAKKLEALLRGPDHQTYLKQVFSQPASVSPESSAWEELRFLTEVFTRMRFCQENGDLYLKATGNPKHHPKFVPWFKMPNRAMAHQRILFGHWSSLKGNTGESLAIALDTGCVWGNCLTAFHIETQTRITVDCEKA